MPFKIQTRVASPDTTMITAEITLTMDDWKKLKDQLGTRWPGWKICEVINLMIDQVESHPLAKTENLFSDERS